MSMQAHCAHERGSAMFNLTFVLRTNVKLKFSNSFESSYSTKNSYSMNIIQSVNSWALECFAISW